ncbi:MAG: hypothetical protein VX834_05410 [Myxococcota bacterium]|nr:hypothetical protein [Myxococcota bacterium]
MNHKTLLFALTLAAVSCTHQEPDRHVAPGEAGTQGSSSADSTPDHNSTQDEPPVFVSPPDGCTIPAPLPADPLERTQDAEATGHRRHLVNLVHDAERALIFACGTPGIEVYDQSDGKLTRLTEVRGKIEHLALGRDGLLAASSRGRSPRNGTELTGMGLYLYDTTDETDPSLLSYTLYEDASGLAVVDTWAYLLSHDGKLRTIDIANPENPTLIHTLEGLGNPWAIIVEGDYAYVADNTQGVVAISLETPSAPMLLSSTPTIGGAQDITYQDGFLYTAGGSAGIEVFNLDTPAAPVSVAELELGGAVISVSANNNLLWATNQESVLVVDITDPARPVQLASEDTASWAMHTVALGARAYVADWRSLALFEYDTSLVAPESNSSRSEVYFTGGSRMQSFTLQNRGGTELTIAGMRIDDPRFSVQVDRLSVNPGDKATVQILFEDDGQPIDTNLCVATNDPDAPIENIAIASTSSSGSSVLIGETAPNFNLPGLDGQYYELNRQLGSPVVLSYFATW